MLILTRREGQSIIIGDDVKVTVVDVKGGNVRLGIEAPFETSVHRQEVYEKIQSENRLAASLTPGSLSMADGIFRGFTHRREAKGG